MSECYPSGAICPAFAARVAVICSGLGNAECVLLFPKKMATISSMKMSLAGAVLGAFLFGVVMTPIARATDEPASSASTESTFVGKWKVQDGKERVFFIHVKAGGEATSEWEDAAESRRGQSGTWELLENKLVITWANGWREVISAGDNGFVKKAYAPNWSLDKRPANEAAAEKVE